jgi:hypothetical protein
VAAIAAFGLYTLFLMTFYKEPGRVIERERVILCHVDRRGGEWCEERREPLPLRRCSASRTGGSTATVNCSRGSFASAIAQPPAMANDGDGGIWRQRTA